MATGPMSEVLQHLCRTANLREAEGKTDGQLLEDFLRRRDEAAVTALVRRHGPMVWGTCRRLLADHHDAEDAFQATFLVLLRKAPSVAPRELVANWLYGVARQTALKARAMAARRRARERPVAVLPEAAAAEADHDLQRLLDQELSRLPAAYRAAIVLCDLEGRTRAEAARQLGWPEGTVAGRLARARGLLAKRLARYGLAVAGGALALAAEAPPALAAATVQAALKGTSVRVATLTETVVNAMWLTKVKLGSAALLTAAAVAFLAAGPNGAAPGLAQAPAAPPARPRPAAEGPSILKRLATLPAELAAAKQTDDEALAAVFRAALDRAPTAGERALAQQHLHGAKDREEALRNVLWAVVNTREFLKHHGLDADPVENLKLVNDLSAGWAFPAPARPEPPAVPAATIKTFLLRNVPAEEAARVLDELFQGQKSLRIAAHARSNTVFVQGAPADLIVVEAVVTRLDTAAQPPPPSPKDPLTKRDAARVMVAEAEADVRQWQDRVTWIDRMVQKGYATADQAQRDRASLKKAEAALAAAKGGVEKAPAPAAGVPPQTTRLQDLHQERLAILRAVADQVSEAHRRGETHQAAVLEANLAVLQAELDACATDQERLPVLEKLAAAARAQEDRIAALVKAGNVSSTHLQQARVKRLEAEIALEKARRK